MSPYKRGQKKEKKRKKKEKLLVEFFKWIL